MSALTRRLRGLGGRRALAPLATVLAGLLVAAAFIALSGRDPVATLHAVFVGSGLDWLLPWTGDRATAATNLQQTLLLVTPLLLLGMAVALPFRAGLLNIGGQGSYVLGSSAAVWVGSSLGGLPGWAHVVLAMAAGALAGGLLTGLAGVLKTSFGAHEVITTIMLNYVAVWIGAYLFGLGGPLQDPSQPGVPSSRTIASAARLPVFWGDPQLQGAHVGLFVALAIVLITGVVLARAAVGYEIRAVGASAEAARYGGIGVGRTLVKVMLVSGLFAGLAGALDVLGWEFHLDASDITASQIGYLGIAVALLGRNSAGGVIAASVLFGALVSGTSQRNLDPSVFPPSLAGGLAIVVQGIIVLVVAVDLLSLRLPRRLRHLRPARRAARTAEAGAER
ncbi:MAG TPA: ABC transporter permease [Conexibacter sp.]|nr:ABC transporter permease [Conexibacter sp.]